MLAPLAGQFFWAAADMQPVRVDHGRAHVARALPVRGTEPIVDADAPNRQQNSRRAKMSRKAAKTQRLDGKWSNRIPYSATALRFGGFARD